ncbi:MAG: WbuC family cupin fold metalloprotein [Bacteroidales bacterium]|nr:WbuC family cupin fold metalloprotein [Bacteroidales bacterium]
MIIIDKSLIDVVSEKAKIASRKRMNHNFHVQEDDVIQRLLNAMEPDTYVRPHKHENPDKREVFIILKGMIAIVIFNDVGKVTEKIIMNRKSGVYGVEIPARKWHTLVSLETGSVLYEIKDGPYNAMNDKIFADWAPDEGSEDAKAFLKNIIEKI